MSKTETTLAKREESLSVPQPEQLIAMAIERGVDVDALEKLLAMRERLQQEQARNAYIAAMAAFQAECPPIHKTRQADRYRYAPLDVIAEQTKALREKYGFSYRFDTRFEQDPPAMVALCIVSHKDGHSEMSEFRTPIDADNRARMNSLQSAASSQTYGKRYAFINAFGIMTADDDDDGRGAAQNRPSVSQPPQRPPAPPGGSQPPSGAPTPTGKKLRYVRAAQKPVEAPAEAEKPRPLLLDAALANAIAVIGKQRRDKGESPLPEDDLRAEAENSLDALVRKSYGHSALEATDEELAKIIGHLQRFAS